MCNVNFLLFFYYNSGTCPFGGDGDCDGDHNNQECNYDDGDCCLSNPRCAYFDADDVFQAKVNLCTGSSCLCHISEQNHCPEIGEILGMDVDETK